MSNIILSSSEVKLIDPNINPSDFSVKFEPAIDLGNLGFEVAFVRFDGWFTSVNISGKTIVWTSDGVTPITVTIPDGNYTVESINDLLAQSQIAQGVTDVDAVTGERLYGIKITPNYNTNRVVVTIDNTINGGANTFTLDLTAANALTDFLGFTSSVVTSTTSGTLIPNVNNGADQYQIHVDIINQSYSSGNSGGDVIYSFVPNVDTTAAIKEEARHLLWLQVNKSVIYSIRVRITDQLGNLIDFAGMDTVVTLHIRKIR